MFFFFCIIMAFAGGVHARTYTYTLNQNDLPQNGGNKLIFGSIPLNINDIITEQNIEWSTCETNYIGWNSTKGIQIGTKNSPCHSFNLKTSSFSNINNLLNLKIKKVTVFTSMAQGGDAKLSIRVGNSISNTFSLTDNGNEAFVYECNDIGDIELNWSATKRAYYIKRIEVEYFFTSESSNITYIVDNEIYKIVTYEHGDTITPINTPEKEGHTFSGWSEIPETMPAEDITITGSFSVNSYTITYIVDGETYYNENAEYGTNITLIDEPIKEGYTFSGWSKIPETMPAEDITITGSFSVNSYTITYVVDGEIYYNENAEYGTNITLIDEPIKEGYTFSEWSKIPETMPAEDITITGSFSINSYTITYIVDGEKYKTETAKYGTRITPAATPTKDNRKFSGWNEIPKTMPAEDIIIEGSFSYSIIFMVDGKYYHRLEVYYGSDDIKLPQDPQKKEGHTFSGWSGLLDFMPARDITVHAIYNVNKHQLIFIIDGEIYETLYIDYGSKIEYPIVPEFIIKWDIEYLPETMPDEELIIIGTTTADTSIDSINTDNKEKVVYTIDGLRLLDVENLNRGIYLINGKKVIVR